MEEEKIIDIKEKSCCTSKDENTKTMKHGTMMMLCCLLPIVLILALPLLGFGNLGWSAFILIHVGMMFYMMRKKH